MMTHSPPFSPKQPTEEAAIPPLPSHLLPPPECKGKGGGDNKKKKNKKTRKEKQEEEAAAAAAAAAPPEQQDERRKEGLEKTVEEMLRDYVPASVEGKRPFYCRVCRFQGGRCVNWNLGWCVGLDWDVWDQDSTPLPTQILTKHNDPLISKPPKHTQNPQTQTAWKTWPRTRRRSCTSWPSRRSGA